MMSRRELETLTDRRFEIAAEALRREARASGDRGMMTLYRVLRAMKPTIVKSVVLGRLREEDDVAGWAASSLAFVLFSDRSRYPEEWFGWSERELCERLREQIGRMVRWMNVSMMNVMRMS